MLVRQCRRRKHHRQDKRGLYGRESIMPGFRCWLGLRQLPPRGAADIGKNRGCKGTVRSSWGGVSCKEIIMALTQTVNINFKAGIVSPGYLKEVLQLAADARVETVHFGLRQQLIIDVP